MFFAALIFAVGAYLLGTVIARPENEADERDFLFALIVLVVGGIGLVVSGFINAVEPEPECPVEVVK